MPTTRPWSTSLSPHGCRSGTPGLRVSESQSRDPKDSHALRSTECIDAFKARRVAQRNAGTSPRLAFARLSDTEDRHRSYSAWGASCEGCRRQASQHAFGSHFNSVQLTTKALRALSLREAVFLFCRKAIDRGHFWPAQGGDLAYADMPLPGAQERMEAPLKASWAHSEPQAPWPPSLVRTTHLWEGVELSQGAFKEADRLSCTRRWSLLCLCSRDPSHLRLRARTACPPLPPVQHGRDDNVANEDRKRWGRGLACPS